MSASSNWMRWLGRYQSDLLNSLLSPCLGKSHRSRFRLDADRLKLPQEERTPRRWPGDQLAATTRANAPDLHQGEINMTSRGASRTALRSEMSGRGRAIGFPVLALTGLGAAISIGAPAFELLAFS